MLRLPRALHRDFAGMWLSYLCLKTTLELAPFSALRWESCHSTAGQQGESGDSLLTHSLRARRRHVQRGGAGRQRGWRRRQRCASSAPARWRGLTRRGTTGLGPAPILGDGPVDRPRDSRLSRLLRLRFFRLGTPSSSATALLAAAAAALLLAAFAAFAAFAALLTLGETRVAAGWLVLLLLLLLLLAQQLEAACAALLPPPLLLELPWPPPPLLPPLALTDLCIA